jgi:hypothetical protein
MAAILESMLGPGARLVSVDRELNRLRCPNCRRRVALLLDLEHGNRLVHLVATCLVRLDLASDDRSELLRMFRDTVGLGGN